MPDVGFVNGGFLALEDARVSVEDRGFQFGDGVYEVIRTYGGRPFQFDAHIARLDRSAKAIDLANPYGSSEWRRLIDEGIKRADYPECKIYLQLTRGAAPRDHTYPSHVTPTVIMTIREFHPLDESIRARGVTAITMPDLRWGRCDIKSLNLLPNVLARQQAREAGAFEALLVRDGLLMEGSVSNVMIVRGGVLMTPPEGPTILSGVTRQVVLSAARHERVPVEERPLTRSELSEAEEVILTGTTVEVLSVVEVDRRAVGTGRPGQLAANLAGLFRRTVDQATLLHR